MFKMLYVVTLFVVVSVSGNSPLPTDQEKKDGTGGRKGALKVMSYNIHHCNPPSEKEKIDVAAIARVINQEKPDLVALQEVDNYTERSGKHLHQARELARLTGMRSFFMKALDFQGGEYGVAVLSRLPIVDSVGYLLPRHAELGGEDRAVATITVMVPGGGKVVFASTHLDLKEGNRISQAEAIVGHFRDTPLPMILAGDFNAQVGSKTINYLDQHFTRSCAHDCQPTIPVENPDRAIDFVMMTPKRNLRPVSTWVIAEKYASDHLPVVAVISMK